MREWSARSTTRRRRAARAARALVAGAAALAAGCDDGPTGGDGSTLPPPTLCDRAVTVSIIASGDLPTIGWAPACGVTDVVVTREEDGAPGTTMWHVRFPERQPGAPTVRYSQLPPRGAAVVGPLPLVRGATYRATVRSVVGGDVLVAAGSTTFLF